VPCGKWHACRWWCNKGRNYNGGEGRSQVEDVDGGKSKGIESRMMDDGGRRLGVENNMSNEKKWFSLVEVWKEDIDFGSLLLSLVNLFGENMLRFIPTEELSLVILWDFFLLWKWL
jgi:hypothetical protein